jgi:hypothetical protein
MKTVETKDNLLLQLCYDEKNADNSGFYCR